MAWLYNKTMVEISDTDQKIADIETELANLDNRRSQLLDELTQLRQLSTENNTPAQTSSLQVFYP